MNNSPRTLRWIFVIFSLVLMVGLFIPIPLEGRIEGAMGDSLHAVVFAVFSFLFYRVLVGLKQPKTRYLGWITCLSLIVLGAVTEVGQYWVGRNFSLKDILANGFGAVAGTLCAVALERRRSRRFLMSAAGLLVLIGMTPALINLLDAVIQYRDFPVVASFEQPLERLRWQTWWCTIHRAHQHATDGDWSMQIDLLPGLYPGIGTSVPPADWTGHKELVFDIELDEGPSLDWYVKIEDRLSHSTDDGRFERRFSLKPGRQRITIPLADVEAGSGGRRMDLTHIHFLQLFTIELTTPRTVFVDNLRLR